MAASPLPIQVEKIDHVVTPVYGGLVLINDTLKISPTVENATIERFSIGFPRKYSANMRYSMAFSSENFNEHLQVDLDTGLGVAGYYGVTITFPPEIRDLLHNGESHTFTIIFVLADLIQSLNTQLFTVDFPAYPSLLHEVSTCNTTVILPENTNYTESDLPFTAIQKAERYILNITETNLPKLSREFAKVSFSFGDSNEFACFSVKKQDREIEVDNNGRISLSELYVLESKTAFTISKIKLKLSDDVSNVFAFDEQGKEILTNASNVPEVPLVLVANQSKSFRLIYSIPSENHLTQQGSQSYVLTLGFSENLQLMPQLLAVKIVFPEGAAIQSFPDQTFNLQRDVFQDSLSLSLTNFTWLQNEQVNFTYNYTIFWTSFRPTIWVTALVVVGSIIAFAWQRPEAPMPVSVDLVPRKTLTNFVEVYEERKKVYAELEQMQRKARKGKISRRRYKIRKTTLENRASTFSKRLAELQQKIMSGGAKYADIMRQFEVTETEIDNIEADMRRIEVRFKRGEISAQAYRRLLEEDLRRRERAKTTIDGLLLRLRE